MTALLLVCHQGVGQAIDAAVRSIVEDRSDHKSIEITIVEEDRAHPDQFQLRLHKAIDVLTQRDQLLILTDLPGATPHNMAVRAAANHAVPVVSGLNMPMLLRCVHHADLTPFELAHRAVEGARLSIFRSEHDAA